MAVHRTKTYFDLASCKYEHEYIVNNYNKIFKFLHIQTPYYFIENDTCKYNFIIEPSNRRYIIIHATIEFPLDLEERRCFDIIAECYNETRTSTTTTSSLNKASKSKLVSQDEKSIIYRSDYDTDSDYSDSSDDDNFDRKRFLRLRLYLEDIVSIKKLRIKIKCSYNRIVESNDVVMNTNSSHLSVSSTSSSTSDTSLLTLYNNKIPFDMNIKIGKRTFSTHKHILILRSDYFKTLFESSFQEHSKNDLVLNDVNSDTFDIMLKYLYTGKSDWGEKKEDGDKIELLVIDLFKLADRFLIDSLKHLCLEQILQYINKENIFSYLTLLMTYDDCQQLKEKCFSLFHKYPTLLKTSYFHMLEKSNPSLAIEIYSTFFK